MKKTTTILSLLLVIILTSCSGSDGRDGVDGLDAEYSKVIEVTGIDYVYDDANNEWFTQNPIPFDGVEVLEGDAVLVYLADGSVTASDGEPTELWKLMPITFFDANGEFQYEFNHTFENVELNIVGNFDLSTLNNAAVSNQTVRIVIIPTEYAENFNGDFSNYNEVMSALELNESDVQILQ
ncbi:collagen-like protein [Leeuwenhoekiella polynyae]|uniref:Uncharacterized protein n=1 Tax=Leeuwenhoekiella polynyae TaxID=1550906 RepID=A0A4Q0NXW4_9FLAO|nr:collagen-like protein [Leeuwenhoekiella polynyae]RXG17733.1 hypothetical protein DSM02_3069 [Leeuwenhoekiella polynyae]